MSIRFFGRCAMAAALILSSNHALAQPAAAAPTEDKKEAAPLDWMADANIGALRLENADMQAAGDLTLGLGQDWWGVVAWGSGSAYQIDNADVMTDTTRLEGKGDAWLNTGDATDVLRLSLRASGGGLNYSSTIYRKAGAGSFADATSWMGRGSLLVGAAFQPDPSFSAYLALGGGVQYEWYDTTTAVTATYALNDTTDLSVLGNGRFDAVWIVARDVVSLRIRTRATYFQLTRDNEFLGTSSGSTAQRTSTTYSQLEVSSRGFIDVDAAAFYGFRPTLHGGLDYVRISGEGESQSTSIPVFGAGLLRPWE